MDSVYGREATESACARANLLVAIICIVRVMRLMLLTAFMRFLMSCVLPMGRDGRLGVGAREWVMGKRVGGIGTKNALTGVWGIIRRPCGDGWGGAEAVGGTVGIWKLRNPGWVIRSSSGRRWRGR